MRSPASRRVPWGRVTEGRRDRACSAVKCRFFSAQYRAVAEAGAQAGRQRCSRRASRLRGVGLAMVSEEQRGALAFRASSAPICYSGAAPFAQQEEASPSSLPPPCSSREELRNP